MAILEVEFVRTKISPIIAWLNVEFETGVLYGVIIGLMIRRALRWMDSDERDCSTDIDEFQRDRHIRQPGR